MAVDLPELRQQITGDASSYVQAFRTAAQSLRDFMGLTDQGREAANGMAGAFRAQVAEIDRLSSAYTKLQQVQLQVATAQATMRQEAEAYLRTISRASEQAGGYGLAGLGGTRGATAAEINDYINPLRPAGTRGATAAEISSVLNPLRTGTTGAAEAQLREVFGGFTPSELRDRARQADLSFQREQARIRGGYSGGTRGATASDLYSAFAGNVPDQQLLAMLENAGASQSQLDTLLGPRVKAVRGGEGASRGIGLGRFGSMTGAIGEVFSGLNDVSAGFRQVTTGFVTGMEETLKAGLGGIRTSVDGFVKGIGTIAQGIMKGDVFGAPLTGLGQMIGSTISGVGGAVGGAVSGLSHIVSESIKGLGKMIGGGIMVVGGATAAGLLATGVGAPAALATVVGTMLAAKGVEMVSELLGTVAGAVGKLVGSVLSTVSQMIGQTLTSAMGGVGGFLQHMVESGMNYQRMQTSFGVLLGGRPAGNRLFADIEKMSMNSTYSMEQLGGAAETLLGMGVAPGQLKPILQAIGNMAGGDAGRLRRGAFAVGETMAEGRLSGQRIRQFAALGLGVNDFATTMGVSGEAFRGLLHSDMVPPEVLLATLNRLQGPGGRMENRMGAQLENASGQWSRLQSVVEQTVGKMGDAFLKGGNIAKIFESVASTVNQASPTLIKFAEEAGKFFGAVAGQAGQLGIAAINTIGSYLPDMKGADWNEIVKQGFDVVVDAAGSFALTLAQGASVLADVIDSLIEFGKTVVEYTRGWRNMGKELLGNWNPFKKEFWIPPSFRGEGALNDPKTLELLLPPSLRGGGVLGLDPFGVANQSGGGNRVTNLMRSMPGAVIDFMSRLSRARQDARNFKPGELPGVEPQPDITLLNKSLGHQASQMAMEAMKQLGTQGQFGIPGEGVTPFQVFQRQLGITQNPLFMEQMSGVPGALGLETAKAYEKLKSSLGNITEYAEHLAPAATYGSSEAMDRINKAQLDTNSVQEEILVTLQAAATLSRGQLDRLDEIAKSLAGSPVIRQVGAN